FAIITIDPFSFDVLLDLYDTFATLHTVLTEHLPKLDLGRFDSSDDHGRKLLDGERVGYLAEIADALHNAMLHRTSIAFRDATWRDMAVDFRGGMNQILFATDAPLKCCLGVLRRFAHREGSARPKDTVGCVIRIGMRPGVKCWRKRLGIEQAARLAFFD